MKNKTGIKSINKNQSKTVKKETPPSEKYSLLKKSKETGNNNPILKGPLALRKNAAKPLNIEDAEKYQNIMENIHDGCFEVDLEGNFVFFNDSVCRVFGYSREELMGMNYRYYSDKETVKKVFLAYNEVYKTGKPLEEFSWQIKRKDGAIRHIEGSISLQRDSSGKPTGFLGIANDVTERKEAEESLKKASSEWQATFNAVSDAICLLDVDQRILRCNRTMHEMFGVKQEQLVGRHCWEIVHGTKEPIPECPVSRIINSLVREETEIQIKNRWLNVIADPILDEAGAIRGIVHIVRDITERKRVEEELHREEQRFRAFIEHSSDITVLMNREGIISYINPAVERVLGFKVEERIGARGLELVHPDDRKPLIDKFRTLYQDTNTPSVPFEMRLRHKDGSWRTVEAVGSKLAHNNVVESIIVNYRDITERKRMEEELRAEEQRFRTLAEQSSDIIVIVNREGIITYENPAVERFLGLKTEGRIGGSIFERIHPDDLKFAKDLYNAFTSDTSSKDIYTPVRQIRIRHKDGSWRTFETVGSKLLHNNIFEAVIINLRDITERKKVEDVLRESEERYRTFFDTSRDCVFMSSIDGRWLNMNNSALDFFGYSSKEELMKIRIPDLYLKKEDRAKYIDALLEKGYSKDYPVDLLRKDGKIIHALITSSVRYDADGNVKGIMGTIKDITERKKAEDEIRHLNESLEQRVRERTTELEAFSYSVSHDLRAPLRAIDGFSQALLEDYENKLDTQGKDYLMRIRTSTRLMAELIEDLLKLSRVTRSEMDIVPVNLSKMARSIMDGLQKSQPQRLANIKIADSLEDLVDPRLMRIVLENLLGNAWKFTGKKTIAEIEFKSTKKDKKKVYFIRDNGAGFDMEYGEKLFAPFQRLHNVEEYSGTGIGLATVKRIISRHGGTVWAEGEPGQGATFYFTLHE